VAEVASISQQALSRITKGAGTGECNISVVIRLSKRQPKAPKVERKGIKQFNNELKKTEVTSKITQHQSCFGELE